MKSIFTKLSTLLFCGAVALIGCTDFSADLQNVNDKLDDLAASAATKTEVSALKADVEALQTKLNNQYATKQEVAAVEDAIDALQNNMQTALTSVQSALSNKADKTELQNAVSSLESALSAAEAEFTTVLEGVDARLQTLESDNTTMKQSLESLSTQVETLLTDVQGLKTNVEALTQDLSELNGSVETLAGEFAKTVTDVETVTKNLETLTTAFNEYKDKVDAELAKIAKQFEETIAGVNTKFDGINEQIAGLNTADKTLQDALAAEVLALETKIENVNTLLAEKVAALIAADEELSAKDEELSAKDEELAAKDEELAAKDEELEAAIEELVDAYNDLDAYIEDQFNDVSDEIDDIWDNIDDIRDNIDDILDQLSNDYEDIRDTLDAITDQLNELAARVDALENELRSIVNVPQVIVNGVNSVEFKTLTFVPMGAYDDQVAPVAETETVVVPTYAYFRFNPSSFALANAEYSVVTENAEIRTKAAVESLTIKSVSEEDGKVKVELERGAGVDNMFALAATLKSNNAVVYSDYVQIVDTKLTAEDVKIVDENNNELYTVLEDAQNNAAAVAIEVGETFSVAEYVNVLGLDMEEFGLELAFDVVKGQAEISEGVLTAVEAAEATNNIVKVEVVSNGSVVRRAYINVRVIGLVTYFNAEVSASLSANRWVYSFENIPDWVKTLKDQPNTLELVKSALESVKNQDIFAAISTLGGIPGFAIETINLEGVGTARVKVDYTASGYIESQLDRISDIKTVEQLVAYLQHIEDIYIVSDLKDTVDEALGTVIDYLVPEQYKNNEIYKWVKEHLLNWRVTSLFDFENDIVADIPLVGRRNVSEWARDKINGVLNSNSALTQRIQNALVNVVSEIEQAYRENIDSSNASAEEFAVTYAKSTSALEAKTVAKAAADAALVAKNAAELAALNDGIYGSLVKILNSDYCKTQFEENGLAEVYAALQTVCGYVEDFVQYTAGNCEFSEVSYTEEQVYE